MTKPVTCKNCGEYLKRANILYFYCPGCGSLFTVFAALATDKKRIRQRGLRH